MVTASPLQRLPTNPKLKVESNVSGSVKNLLYRRFQFYNLPKHFLSTKKTEGKNAKKTKSATTKEGRNGQASSTAMNATKQTSSKKDNKAKEGNENSSNVSETFRTPLTIGEWAQIISEARQNNALQIKFEEAPTEKPKKAKNKTKKTQPRNKLSTESSPSNTESKGKEKAGKMESKLSPDTESELESLFNRPTTMSSRTADYSSPKVILRKDDDDEATEDEEISPKKPKPKWEPSEELKILQSSKEYNPLWKIELLVEMIKQEKGEDICVIDLRNKTEWMSFMILVTGRTGRHCRAIAEIISSQFSKLTNNSGRLRIHASETNDWIIVKAGDTLVEILTEDMRKKYDIERLWVLKRSSWEEAQAIGDELNRFMFDPDDGMLDQAESQEPLSKRELRKIQRLEAKAKKNKISSPQSKTETANETRENNN